MIKAIAADKFSSKDASTFLPAIGKVVGMGVLSMPLVEAAAHAYARHVHAMCM